MVFRSTRQIRWELLLIAYVWNSWLGKLRPGHKYMQVYQGSFGLGLRNTKHAYQSPAPGTFLSLCTHPLSLVLVGCGLSC